jgi:hypothetical protein
MREAEMADLKKQVDDIKNTSFDPLKGVRDDLSAMGKDLQSSFEAKPTEAKPTEAKPAEAKPAEAKRAPEVSPSAEATPEAGAVTPEPSAPEPETVAASPELPAAAAAEPASVVGEVAAPDATGRTA